MGDALNLNINIADLGLTDDMIEQAVEDAANDKWITKLADGGVYLAKITDISEKINDDNIGYNISLDVMLNPDATVYDVEAKRETLKYNYLWSGRNAGTAAAPIYEQPTRNGKGYIPPQLIQFIGAVGTQMVVDNKVSFAAAVGAIIKVKIKHEEYQGNVNAKVDRWLKAEGVVNVAASAKPVAPEPLL